jgi:hypothetical protein
VFAAIANNADDSTYRLAQDVLKGQYAWLEEGAITAWPDEAPGAPRAGGSTSAGTPSERAPISGSRVAEQVGATG